MWAAAMVLWSGLELLSNNIKTPSHQSRFGFVLGLFYFGFCTVLAILAGMGWSVASRVDILGWFLLAAILSLVSMVISVQSQPMKASESESKNEEEESIMPGDASEPDGRQPGDQNHRTCANRLLRVLCVFMKLFHISFLALLANGGIQAAINHSYPPR